MAFLVLQISCTIYIYHHCINVPLIFTCNWFYSATSQDEQWYKE